MPRKGSTPRQGQNDLPNPAAAKPAHQNESSASREALTSKSGSLGNSIQDTDNLLPARSGERRQPIPGAVSGLLPPATSALQQTAACLNRKHQPARGCGAEVAIVAEDCNIPSSSHLADGSAFAIAGEPHSAPKDDHLPSTPALPPPPHATPPQPTAPCPTPPNTPAPPPAPPRPALPPPKPAPASAAPPLRLPAAPKPSRPPARAPAPAPRGAWLTGADAFTLMRRSNATAALRKLLRSGLDANQPLCDCHALDAAAAAACLSRAASSDASAHGTWPLLCLAAHAGGLGPVELLLKAGADPTWRSPMGFSAITFAVESPYLGPGDQLAVVEALLSRCGDVGRAGGAGRDAAGPTQIAGSGCGAITTADLVSAWPPLPLPVLRPPGTRPGAADDEAEARSGAEGTGARTAPQGWTDVLPPVARVLISIATASASDASSAEARDGTAGALEPAADGAIVTHSACTSRGATLRAGHTAAAAQSHKEEGIDPASAGGRQWQLAQLLVRHGGLSPARLRITSLMSLAGAVQSGVAGGEAVAAALMAALRWEEGEEGVLGRERGMETGSDVTVGRVLAEVVYAALGQQPRAAPGGGVGATPGSKASATPGPPRPGPLRLVDGLLRRGLDPTAPLWPGGRSLADVIVEVCCPAGVGAFLGAGPVHTAAVTSPGTVLAAFARRPAMSVPAPRAGPPSAANPALLRPPGASHGPPLPPTPPPQPELPMLLRLLLLGGSGSGSGSGVGAAAPGSNGGTTGRQHQQQQQQPLLHGQARRGMPVGALAAAGGGYKPVGVCIGPPSQPPPPLLVRLASQAGSQVALTALRLLLTESTRAALPPAEDLLPPPGSPGSTNNNSTTTGTSGSSTHQYTQPCGDSAREALEGPIPRELLDAARAAADEVPNLAAFERLTAYIAACPSPVQGA